MTTTNNGGASSIGASSSSTTSSSPNNNSSTVDGKAVAVSLAISLLELSLTLTASYLFSKWITKIVQQNNAAANAGGGEADGMDGFEADNGNNKSGTTVVQRLENLLISRYHVTLNAMMEELNDKDGNADYYDDNDEEKKEECSSSKTSVIGRLLAQDMTPKKTTIRFDLRKKLASSSSSSKSSNQTQSKSSSVQYANALSTALTKQHEVSLSYLTTLTPYEIAIAQNNCIDPTSLSVTFSDVGGMDDIKSEVYDLVVLPLLRPDLFVSDSGLVAPPKGILLYGPPGTGKTMLAKAIAKESHATFVNVQLSTIMNKWFGESNKLISATFQLARKLAPSVVFIDEIDAFLSQRDSTEGSAVSSMKSEFLTLWDGLLSERKGMVSVVVGDNEIDEGDEDLDGSSGSVNDRLTILPAPPVIVLGATNRPYDVDPAILRRLPRSFEIPLPPAESRLQLLELFLARQPMTPAAKNFIPEVARRTEGYSGSDLKEVCRAAAWEPVREMTSGASRRAAGCVIVDNTTTTMKQTNTSTATTTMSNDRGRGFPPRGTKARPVNENDLLIAIRKVKRTGESARQFQTKEFVRGREERASMAADVNRAMNGISRNNKHVTTTTTNESNGGQARQNRIQASNVDIQQLLTTVMAAVSSMQILETNDSEESQFDDVPPEM